jgi:hypothetical protein
MDQQKAGLGSKTNDVSKERFKRVAPAVRSQSAKKQLDL